VDQDWTRGGLRGLGRFASAASLFGRRMGTTIAHRFIAFDQRPVAISFTCPSVILAT
jgi:hypothetical protein